MTAGERPVWHFATTLVVCQKHLIQVWWDECHKWFPDLEIWRYFESPDRVADPVKKRFTIPSDGPGKWHKDNCAPNDWRTAFKIVESPYTTCGQRSVVERPKLRSGKQPAPEGMYALQSIPSPSLTAPIVSNRYGRTRTNLIGDTYPTNDEDKMQMQMRKETKRK